MAELTDAEMLKNITEYVATGITKWPHDPVFQHLTTLLDPPKPDPIGRIKLDDLPEKNTTYEHKIQDTRTLLRVSVDTERIAYFWECESRFGVGITSITNWNYDFAVNVVAVHPPVKQERAKIVLMPYGQRSIQIGKSLKDYSVLDLDDNAGKFINKLAEVLESLEDAAGNPRIKVTVK